MFKIAKKLNENKKVIEVNFSNKSYQRLYRLTE